MRPGWEKLEIVDGYRRHVAGGPNIEVRRTKNGKYRVWNGFHVEFETPSEADAYDMADAIACERGGWA